MKKRLLIGILPIQLLVTCFYAGNLDNPKYSFIGDEYHIFIFAQNILTGFQPQNPLSLYGVFGQYPVLGSYYQAGVMLLFGNNIFGWKLSSIFIIFPLGLIMFYLVKRIGTLSAAFFALIATDVSFYFYNYFQIGYLNNQSLLCLVVLLYLVAFINPKQKLQSYKPYLILGIATGLSWYFYLGKLFLFIMSAYLLIINKCSLKIAKQFVLFFVSAAVIIGIGFLNTPAQNMDLGLSKSIVHREFHDNLTIVKNMFYPFILDLYSPAQTHYLPRKSYVDQITATLASIGFLLLLLSIFFKRFRLYAGFHNYVFLFVLVAISIGFTSPYSEPPVTRGIHYVPFYIIFATYCLLYITHLLREKKVVTAGIYVAATVGVVFLNIAFINAPVPDNTTKKLFTYIKSQQSSDIYFLKNKHCFNFSLVVTMIQGYNLPDKAQMTDNVDKYLCQKGKTVVTCGVNVCGTKPTKVFDNFIYLYNFK
jgi:hypothetical protein